LGRHRFSTMQFVTNMADSCWYAVSYLFSFPPALKETPPWTRQLLHTVSPLHDATWL
jgi:hypothetical protein